VRRVLQLVSALYALSGQAADVWTTKIGTERGLREQNPLLRRLVEERRFGQILTLKLGITLVAALAAEWCHRWIRRGPSAADAFSLSGNLGWFAAGWNLVQISRFEKRQRRYRANVP